MKIEIWSDIACPYCYIGFKHLESALDQFKGKQPEVKLRSFELEPDIASNSGESQHLAVMRKYHQSPLRAQQTLDGATQAGQQASLIIDFDKVVTTNTLQAHRLIHLAETFGNALEMKDRLFKAYFTEGRNISDRSVLIELAGELGINAGAMLDSEQFTEEVKTDEHTAQRLGIRSVPYFVFDDKYAISGAQPVTTFLGLLKELQSAELSQPYEDDQSGCEGGSCKI